MPEASPCIYIRTSPHVYYQVLRPHASHDIIEMLTVVGKKSIDAKGDISRLFEFPGR